MKSHSKLSLTAFLAVVLISVGLVGRPSARSQHPKNVKRSTVHSFSGPDCSGGWPTNMAFALLKNAGITNNDKVDFSKTKTVRIASEKIGRDLWRQVYDVTFTEYSGRRIEAIAVHEASRKECSMSEVELYVVSQRLGSGPFP